LGNSKRDSQVACQPVARTSRNDAHRNFTFQSTLCHFINGSITPYGNNEVKSLFGSVRCQCCGVSPSLGKLDSAFGIVPCARVGHPHIVQLFDMGEEPSVGLYLVFEYASGTKTQVSRSIV